MDEPIAIGYDTQAGGWDSEGYYYLYDDMEAV